MADLPPAEAISTLFLLLSTFSSLADAEHQTDSRSNERLRQVSIPSLAYFSQFLVRFSELTGTGTVGEALDFLAVLDSPDDSTEKVTFRVLRLLVQHCRVYPRYLLLGKGPKTVPHDATLDARQVDQLLHKLFYPRGLTARP